MQNVFFFFFFFFFCSDFGLDLTCMVQDQLLLELVGHYGPPGPLTIWKNVLNQICSRSIFWMHAAPGTGRPLWSSWTINNLEECSESNMLQEHFLNAHCSRSIYLTSWSWTISRGQNLKKAWKMPGGGENAKWRRSGTGERSCCTPSF